MLLRSKSCAWFLALVFLIGGWSVATLRFDTQFLQVLPAQLSSVRGLADFARAASGRDTFYVVVDPAIAEEERARILAQVRPALAKIPRVARLEAPGEEVFGRPGVFAAWMLANAPPSVFLSALKAFDFSRMQRTLKGVPERLRGVLDPLELMRVQADPLGIFDAFEGLSAAMERVPDGLNSSFLIGQNARPEEGTAGDCLLLDALEKTAREALEEGDWAHIRFTGDGIFNAQISRQTRADVNVMIGVGVFLLAVAFYLFYRTLAPLPWIFFFQLVTMLCSLIAARWVFGQLNVISVGFGSILLGVGMDYHILVYHHYGSPGRGDAEGWATLRRSIWFSAAVTAASFFLLGFSSFPGLRQMALLVGTGLLSTALCATWLLKKVMAANPPEAPPVVFSASGILAGWIVRHGRWLRWVAGLGVVVLLVSRPWSQGRAFYDADTETLQPTGISAFEGHTWLRKHDPTAESSVYFLRAARAQDLLAFVRHAQGDVVGRLATIQTWGIPEGENLRENLRAWRTDVPESVRRVFSESGLGDEWSGATLEFVDTLQAAARGDETVFDLARRAMAMQSGQDGKGFYALARVGRDEDARAWESYARERAAQVEFVPVSWSALKSEVTQVAQREFVVLAALMLVAVVVLCWAAQRSMRLVLLNVLALGLSLMIFILLLRATDTALTPLTLVSLPLLLGLVIDYSLHLLIALEARRGDLVDTFHHLAAPVLLTGLSAGVGFGAPMITNQPAMRNFGLVMDLGILSAVSACLILLPPFYAWLRPSGDYRNRFFYRALYTPLGFRVILWGWRWLGGWVCRRVARMIGLGYALTHRKTVESVRANLRLVHPEISGFKDACALFMNQAEAFTQYGRLAMGAPEDVLNLIGEAAGLEHLKGVLARGEGCLLVTGHFGFFEFGGLLLSKMGFPVTAITMPEPSPALTEWREQFRLRWGVETIVIGEGAFAALDVVRAIHRKRFVALLVDRPMDNQWVCVDMPHGRVRFSTGPALVALLAKCPVVPVGIVQQSDGRFGMIATGLIEPRWLPEGREASLAELTRRIGEQLLPLFEKHPKQWYHFHSLAVGDGDGNTEQAPRQT